MDAHEPLQSLDSIAVGLLPKSLDVPLHRPPTVGRRPVLLAVDLAHLLLVLGPDPDRSVVARRPVQARQPELTNDARLSPLRSGSIICRVESLS